MTAVGPSWARAAKWALGFSAIMMAFTLATGGSHKGALVIWSLFYGVLFIPFFFLVHRFQYKTAQRQIEKRKAQGAEKKPRAAQKKR